MILRLSASKDTILTNKLVFGRNVTGSNGGASEILQIFKLAQGAMSGNKANTLIAFPTSSAFTAFSSSYATGSISWHLVMTNVETQNPNVGSFDVEIFPVERDWDEGKGHDLDFWTDRGYANWVYAKNGVTWTNQGGRPSAPSFSATYHFEDGHENVDVDVTSMIGSVPYGFWVGVSSTQVADNNDYYLKAFRSRQTHFPEYQPYLEARWNDSTGSYSSSFIDVVDATGVLVGSIYNLRTVYERSETPVLRTYFRPKDWNLAVVTTASTDVSGTVLTNAYYRVVNDVSDETVIPFGTGSTPYTKMSFDDAGNYFRFYMQNLVPGLVYRFDIGYYDINDEWHVFFGEDLKFRVI